MADREGVPLALGGNQAILCIAAKRFAACCFLGRFLPKLGGAFGCRPFFAGLGWRCPSGSARGEPVGKKGVDAGRNWRHKPPPHSDAVLPRQPARDADGVDGKGLDEGAKSPGFLASVPSGTCSFVLQKCRVPLLSAFTAPIWCRPDETARIFENRIGLLEASALTACCRLGPVTGLGRSIVDQAVHFASRVVSGAWSNRHPRGWASAWPRR